MKKLITLLLIAAALLLIGCGASTDNTATDSAEPTAESSTQLHTVPASDAALQLEWAPVDCEITLESSEAIFAKSDGFLTFALVGSTDDDCALRFTLKDSIAEMLAQQKDGVEYYLTVNDKVLKGAVSFSDDFTEVVMNGGYTYSEMCILATEIRGL